MGDEQDDPLLRGVEKAWKKPAHYELPDDIEIAPPPALPVGMRERVLPNGDTVATLNNVGCGCVIVVVIALVLLICHGLYYWLSSSPTVTLWGQSLLFGKHLAGILALSLYPLFAMWQEFHFGRDEFRHTRVYWPLRPSKRFTRSAIVQVMVADIESRENSGNSYRITIAGTQRPMGVIEGHDADEALWLALRISLWANAPLRNEISKPAQKPRRR